ncbi:MULTISPECIES: GAF domain-containing sensor histidine kinase [Pseudomonas]|jgi:signal transduction histidine kinase|uniref:GAF domain-containing sensor histidine kinase n=1 Tax=Pseudomonas TaxID=286 RepID=UPI00123F207B|nr:MULTISPECIES: GAF domain-containing sensor histidine kinase [Pseudomonas]MBP5946688.1 GAF domain-containing sensor histidine kinase [Pseudomonas sp. P9(2020)]MBP5959278.1 GAF domain-containing sensor histidine kinase [Pseudomonas anatoliensis]MBZ9564826.1 GAF domain-containing sensor histidine kinase [Pseudomonas sp. P116]VVO62625.1 Sensor histidine kinase RcsC [Pseudomonas fluorescens]
MTNPEFTSDIEAIRSIDAVPVILSMVKHITGMRFAAVARVTEKNWVACAVDDSIDFGLKPGGELVLESTICHEIRQHKQPVIFGHASLHPLFSVHHTPRTYGLESYISIPIVKANGDFFGTLCAIDSVPANLDEPAIAKTLTLFAQLIAMSLDTQTRLHAAKAELDSANEMGRLREQFIAVLGHDLRTPLSAIRMSADLLETKTQDKRSLNFIAAIRTSSVRMGVLIENILDFARGRLGGGIPVQRKLVDDLQRTLRMTLEEIQVSHPQATFIHTLDVPTGVYCDALRISQMLSNLLGNAVTHGSTSEPIILNAWAENDEIVISLTNQGTPIAPQLMPLLFEPFSRSEAGQRCEGLGLGLYIASQIATAHNGSLSVTSDRESGTCFVARFPAQFKWV